MENGNLKELLPADLRRKLYLQGVDMEIVTAYKKEQSRLAQRKYRENNKETMGFRAEVKKNRGELLATLWNRQGRVCCVCNLLLDLSDTGHNGLHIDHITPLSKSGDSSIENLQLLHADCNRRKGSNLVVV